MKFNEQVQKDIEGILKKHCVPTGVSEDTESFLCVPVTKLGEYSSTKQIQLKEAESHYRNLAEACSALSTFCEDRELNVRYNPESSQFIFWK